VSVAPGSPVAVAFCPHPPLLVTEVGAGEPVAVRAPSIAAVRRLVAEPVQRLVMLGSAAAAGCHGQGSTGSFAGYGVPLEVRLPGDGVSQAPGPLPLSLAVGAWLLNEAGWSGPTLAIACDVQGALPPEFDSLQPGDGLLVMGDGSARRTEKAPGWLDERSAGYDAEVSAALAAGDPAHLGRLDERLGRELLAAGAPAWRAASHLLAGTRWRAEVSYDDAPYGVGYFIAGWSSSVPAG
jgi:hypothetical protein